MATLKQKISFHPSSFSVPLLRKVLLKSRSSFIHVPMCTVYGECAHHTTIPVALLKYGGLAGKLSHAACAMMRPAR